MTTFEEAKREGILRQRAKRLGFRLAKSRTKTPHPNDFGGWMVIDIGLNAVVQGSNFELNLDDVDEYLTSMEIVS